MPKIKPNFVNEKKLEKAIAKALYDLKLYTSLYVGERQAERNEGIPHAEFKKRLMRKLKFRLTPGQRFEIKEHIRSILRKNASHIIFGEIYNYIFKLIERRDEIFRKPPKTDLAAKKLGLRPSRFVRHSAIEGPCECGAWHNIKINKN